MVKKLISSLSIFALLMAFAPLSTTADIVDYIQNFDVTVGNNSVSTFYPASNEVAVAKFTLTQNADIVAYVTDANFNTVATLANNQATVAGAITYNWYGKVGNVEGGVVLANGDYRVNAFALNNGAIVDFAFKDVSIATAPAINITNLTVSPAVFNPLTQTSDISFNISQNAFVTAKILDGQTVKDTLIDNKQLNAGAYSKIQEATLAWDGKDSTNTLLPNKAYTVQITVKATSDGNVVDTETAPVTVSTPATIVINSFTVAPTGNDADFEPAPLGANETLNIAYTLSQAADSVTIEIKNSNNKVVKTFSAASDAEKTTGTYTWDGKYNGEIVDPGTYSVLITAKKTGNSDATQTKNIVVVYNNANKPGISDMLVSPNTFDPDFDDTEISFKNTKDSSLTIEIRNATGDKMKGFDNYNDKLYSANTANKVIWDGKDSSSNNLTLGTYKVYVRSESDYGVAVAVSDVTINDAMGSIPTSNAHVNSISLSPSSNYEPAVDDELKIEFDIKQNLDSLRITAIHGSTEIELYDEEDVDEENNIEVTWDGTDDNDEYADPGSWKIYFESKLENTTLKAAKSITIKYEEPEIDEIRLSKDKFDPDLGEFTYILFKVDSDSDVDIFALVDNDEDDEIAEDMEVVKNEWYAVEWDGGSYDYDDDLDIKIVAKNKANDNVSDTAKISVDLAEDDVSSSKSNVTMDYISPVLSDGNEDMTISYDLEEEADVEITIHKGTSASGSEVAELLNIESQEGDTHEITWNGKDEDGDKLSNGLYTYKIVSDKNSTETETGLFVIGEVGEIDGEDGSSNSSSSSSDDNDDSGINENVIVVDGGSNEASEEEVLPSEEEPSNNLLCGGFEDVASNSKYCDAIEWVKDEGIFKGYEDGTFKPNQAINRAEVLKVILEALDVDIEDDDGTNLGFKDVIIGEWYMPYIKAAKEAGIFHGDAGKNTARPSDTVNRVELLKFIFETLKVKSEFDATVCDSSYPDAEENSWYEDYACSAYEYALFDGNKLLSGNSSSRSEVAEVLYRLHKAGVL